LCLQHDYSYGDVIGNGSNTMLDVCIRKLKLPRRISKVEFKENILFLLVL